MPSPAATSSATGALYRQTSLVLQNVVITGCSSAAVVLLGPEASLQAKDVIFKNNSNAGATHGLIIAAQQASVTLQRVTISGNSAERTAPAQGHQLLTHPACKDSSQTGGVRIEAVTIGSSSSSSGGSISVQPPACGSPVLSSSLILLQDSSLTAETTSIHNNTADALLAVTGSSQQSLQLLAATMVDNNTVTWLVTADSWPADAVGRANIMAQQPSEITQLSNMQPPFTTRSAMGGIREMVAGSATAAAAVSAGLQRMQTFVGAAPQGQVRLRIRGW
jgi:hypothetical protein